MRVVPLSNLEQFAAVNLLADPGHIGGPVVIPNAAQIVLKWNLEDNKQGRNVLYGRYTGAFNGSVAQCNAILAALSSGAQWTALAAFLPPATSLAQVSIRNVGVSFQPEIASSSAGGVGSSASPSLPNEVAACVTIRTALAGIGNRGRFFVPGWATNSLGAGNVIAAGAVTALQNWANTFVTAFSAQGYAHVLGQQARQQYTSPSTGTVHPARPAGTLTVAAVVVRDNHWDTIRRRGLK